MSVFFIHPMRPGCALFFEAVATPGISPRTYHLVMFQCPGLLWLFAFVTQSLELLSCSGHCCLQPQFTLSVHRCIVFCFYLKHFQINTKVENSATSPPPMSVSGFHCYQSFFSIGCTRLSLFFPLSVLNQCCFPFKSVLLNISCAKKSPGDLVKFQILV